MRKNNLKVEKFLDGEKLFKQYYEVMGEARSTVKLVEWCKSVGMVNSKGKAPTRMGTWLSMWRWALDNQERARIIYDGLFYHENDPTRTSDKEWMRFLKQKAYTAFYAGDRYERWCKENNLPI